MAYFRIIESNGDKEFIYYTDHYTIKDDFFIFKYKGKKILLNKQYVKKIIVEDEVSNNE